MTTIEEIDDRGTSRVQDAVRILLIIAAAAVPVVRAPDDDPALTDMVGVVETQVRLQKLDFWVRNPDYLADELLNDYERYGDPTLLRLAGEILDSEEPEVRRYPMLRYLFGAYEPLDDALAVLRSADLIVRRKRGSIAHVQQHDYYLTRRGAQTAQHIVDEAPAFEYFVRRARLAVDLAEGHAGSQLKARQYAQQEYRTAAIGSRIGSITPRVRERLVRYLQALRPQHSGEPA